jgi:hypothetical protein
VLAVFVGVGISLIPTFEDLADGKQKFWSGTVAFFSRCLFFADSLLGKDAVAYVPLYIISLAPAVVFNVLQERTMAERELDDMTDRSPSPMQPFLDQIVILFWSCLFSLMTVMSCFWIDLIPKWGHSKSLSMLV